MNIRTKKIISYLLKSNNTTFNELVSIYDVTPRSIRNDIYELNQFMTMNNLNGIKINNEKVIEFEATELKIALQLINADNNYFYKLSSSERVQYIIEELINNDEYTYIKNLADKLQVSVSTINNDIKKVSSKVKKYNAKYESEPYKGIKLVADEFVKREILLSTVIEKAKQNNAYRVVDVSQTLNDKLSQIISLIEKQCKFILSDKSFQYLFGYLTVMLHRIRDSKYVQSNLEVDIKYHTNAVILSNLVKSEFKVVLNDSEVNSLANILGNSKYIKSNDISNDIIKVQFYITRFIDYIAKQIAVDITDDHLFFIRLSLHVEYMTRKRIKHPVEGSILSGIVVDHQRVITTVANSISILEELLEREINDEERSYIILHVCSAIERKKIKESEINVLLVSDSGIATNQFLVERIKNNFEFTIVDVLPLHSFKDGIAEVDFIISTANITSNVPLVQIETSFNEKDYTNVYMQIKKIKDQKKARKPNKEYDEISNIIKNYGLSKEGEILSEIKKILVKEQFETIDPDVKLNLSQLLDVSLIELDIQVQDWKEAIKKSANILLKNKYITERYIDTMIRKIMIEGPYMVIASGIIVPHAGVYDGGIATKFSMIRLAKSVDIGSSLGDIKYIFCLSVTDVETHVKAFLSLVNLSQNEEFMEALDTCSNPEEAHKLIERYE